MNRILTILTLAAILFGCGDRVTSPTGDFILAAHAQSFDWIDADGDTMAVWASDILNDNIKNFDAATIANYKTIVATGDTLGRVHGRMGRFGDSITKAHGFWGTLMREGYNGDTGFEWGIQMHQCKDTEPYWYFHWEDTCYWENTDTGDSGLGSKSGVTLAEWANMLYQSDPDLYYDHPTDAIESGDYGWTTFMIGSNDVAYNDSGRGAYDATSLAAWRVQLEDVLQEMIDLGTIPVLSTIPPQISDYDSRSGHYVTVDSINLAVVTIAEAMDLAYIDYEGAVRDFQPGNSTTPGVSGNWLGNFIDDGGIHPDYMGASGRDSQYEADIASATGTGGYDLRSFLSAAAGYLLMVEVYEENIPLDLTTIYVATTGNDTSGTGEVTNPFASIEIAMTIADPGDTVAVKTGTYTENRLELPAGITLLSIDGIYDAEIYSEEFDAILIIETDSITVQGFEIYGDWDDSSASADQSGLVKIEDSSDILLKDLLVYDAPRDADCIKILSNQGSVSHNITMDNVIAYNPGKRSADTSKFQENIDILGRGDGSGGAGTKTIVLKNSWLFHTSNGGDYLVYSKFNVEDVTYQDNVFGPSAGLGDANQAVSIGTGERSYPDSLEFAVRDAVVDGNLFLGLKGDGALGVYNSDDVVVGDNIFWNNDGSDLTSVVVLRGNKFELGYVLFNGNDFQLNNPTKGTEKFYWYRTDGGGVGSEITINNNNYYGNVAASDFDYTSEVLGSYGESNFEDPQIPSISDVAEDAVETIFGWFEYQSSGGKTPPPQG